ncbi:NUDIX domain-containing protein [Streptomyces sp. NBC_01190]|uniref:NUDIX domain-containing protein n=1 Tax=Streptomyces sp. NBC_01190 TaxID=2903767 RepID=UPI00386A6481|nr:NUDIX domain-containing protein [Streptomyces sp. NBC_01190]
MTSPTADLDPASCDHTSVGVLISAPDGLLFFERATPPVGLAPVAGHIDHHGSPEQAARAEAAEEVGLSLTHLRLLLTGWRANRCRRPATAAVGHQWWIYEAQAFGSLSPSDREVRAPRWIDPYKLHQLALRTEAYAQGGLSDVEFTRRPGMAPVWVRFLHELKIVTLAEEVLAGIDTII